MSTEKPKEESLQNEQWRPVGAYQNYEVSSLGRVRNKTTGRYLGGGMMNSGYRFVFLCRDGIRPKGFSVHRLIAIAFFGEPVGNRKEVNHKDGNKTNNVLSNLEWVSRSENLFHAADIGVKPSGEASHLCKKLTAVMVGEIRELYRAGGVSQKALGAQFGVAQTYISRIVNNRKWRQV